MDFCKKVKKIRKQKSNSKNQIPKIKFQKSNSKNQIPKIKFQKSNSKNQIPKIKFQIPKNEKQISNSLSLRRMELIRTYFPMLTEHQIYQFDQLGNLYAEWNAQINVISRKDIDNLYERHVLHALSIAKIVTFKAESSVIDLGTGGGFPGIPLAILFPDVKFILIDGTRKKLRVVEAVSEAIKLENVEVKHLRAEACKDKADFVVSRAVASLDKLLHWSRPLLKSREINALPNGLIALKGGNIEAEIKLLPRHEYTETYPLQDYFDRPVFDEKYIVYVQG